MVLRLEGDVAKVLQQATAVFAQDGLGMELTAPLRSVLPRNSHRQAIVGPGDLLEVCRKQTLDDERVIAGRRERRGNSGKQGIAVVDHFRGASVNQRWRLRQGRTRGNSDALMSKADAKQGNARLRNGVLAESKISG